MLDGGLVVGAVHCTTAEMFQALIEGLWSWRRGRGRSGRRWRRWLGTRPRSLRVGELGPVNLLVLQCHVFLLDGAIAPGSPPVR